VYRKTASANGLLFLGVTACSNGLPVFYVTACLIYINGERFSSGMYVGVKKANGKPF
jgi:hypothetical protein